MCGISGIVGASLGEDIQKNKGTIEKMANAISHRGPDATAYIYNLEGTAYLGMNTLRIVNQRGKTGPYLSDDGQIQLTFNGEIYNYKELAKKWGVNLGDDSSDAQVILAGYQHLGPEFIEHLDGMFAIAVFDNRSKQLHMYRDRMGEKPLYYSIRDGVIKFASEVKALGSSQKVINHDFITYENTIGEDTLYNGVYMLLSAHRLTFDVPAGKILSNRAYWDLKNIPLRPFDDCTDISLTFEKILDEAITSRTPPRPFGMLLSGGLDSSILAVKMRPDFVFTVAYPGMERFDETEKAAIVAQKIGAKHIIIRPTPNDFQECFHRVVHHLDYPVGNSSPFSEYMLYKAAANTGIRVLISGIGADELMMGYARHALFLSREEAESPLPSSYDPLVNLYKSRIQGEMPAHEKYYELIRRGPSFSGQKDIVEGIFASGQDVGQSISLVDIAINFPSLLKSADKLSSAFGLEVRAPFLAHTFVEFVYGLPVNYKFQAPNSTKLLLRECAIKSGVPSTIVEDKDKKGFSTPTGKWIKGDLAGWFDKITKNVPDTPAFPDLLAGSRDRGEYDRSDLQLLSLALWK